MSIRTFFYDTAGGTKQFLGGFDRATYEPVAQQLWKRLNDLEPSLWRQGKTYPQGAPAVDRLFGDGEVDAFLAYDTGGIGQFVQKGTFPQSTRTAVFDSGNIENYGYTAIPYNAARRAAAMVLANLLLFPDTARWR